MSNNTMFVGDNDDMQKLYLKATRFYTLLETISGLLKDNPLFDCDAVPNDLTIKENVTSEVRYKYENNFNRLLGCLKTAISQLDHKYKRGIEYQEIDCGVNNNNIGEPGVTPCTLGDYSPADYGSDHFVEVCTNPEPPVVPTVYTGVSTNGDLDASEIVANLTGEVRTGFVGEYDFEAGGYKYFVFPDNWDIPNGFYLGAANMAMSLTQGTYVDADTNFSYRTVVIDTVTYKVYRSLNILGGVVMINVT